ncbi:Aldehyde dehydrogenase [Fusarium albosuccineum]|uniref:aldehyde dehydrogenase (NAD(+)) n=1 Tax=Fusarium albosuccineum TaxID=1237068 RepID=A0A8H4P5J4_9HYPO|nr:Aldehyde dehydrogenase [Fusarium albosuccineum]
MNPHIMELQAPIYKADFLKEDRLFINGEFVSSNFGRKFDVTNPTTEEVIASVYEADSQDVDIAVQAAKVAFPAWAALSAETRCNYLIKLAEEVEQHVEQLTRLEAITMGMTHASSQIILGLVASYLKYYANKAMDLAGETSLNTPKYLNISIRQPYSVCAGIIPWNAPLLMLVNKVGPALASGNTIVLKSSEKSPLSFIAFAAFCQKVNLPKGVINIITGFGRTCGEALAKHMDIRKISFTGSVATERAIQKASAESNLKDVSLELGGKSPLLIFDDASLEKAVPAAAFSILYNSGHIVIHQIITFP